jgi:NAD(P)-dependent dehydrogenase (short-subunit alcohol dehydrogenase family)
MLRKNWGRIVFISSESAINIPADMIHYGLTKTAQLALSRGLARALPSMQFCQGETASEGVTELLARFAKEQNKTIEALEKEFFEKLRPTNLLKRFASPEEVANMVVYVCGAAASATNGSALRVDAGTVRSII